MIDLSPYPRQLAVWHGRPESMRWRLTPRGVEVEGSGVERTRGEPVTVRRIVDTWGQVIDDASVAYGVPAELLVACAAAETRGDPEGRLEEPGFVSDAATPDRVSVGILQTLLSTAREALRNPTLSSQDLLDPEISFAAGAAYMARRELQTLFDPPLVAASYNAGSVRPSTANRWRLVCTQRDEGCHVDWFVWFFNDCASIVGRA